MLVCMKKWAVRYILPIVLLLPLGASTAFSEQVQDLRYGVILYSYFQQSYFNALTEILIAEDKNDIIHHKKNAQLLKGGISLSYGLDQAAEELFDQFLINDSLSPGLTIVTSEDQKARAWFYLGKIRYQRGDYLLAHQALSHINIQSSSIDDTHNSILFSELDYLRAIIALDKNAATSTVNSSQNTQSIYWPFLTFNLAVKNLADGNWEAAQRYFKLFDEFMPKSQVDKALKDRALTALAYAYLQHKQYQDAALTFEKISPDSLLVPNALLGYGWAQLKQQRYQNALAPWQALQQYSLSEPSVREVYLALPYVYELLEGKVSALNAYKLAVDAYQRELFVIEKTIDDYTNQPLVQLIDILSVDESELADFDHEFTVNAHEKNYLAHMLAKNTFQALVKDYRDIVFLIEELTQSEKTLAVLKGVNTEQQKTWLTIIDGDGYQQLQIKRSELKIQLDILQKSITAASIDGSGRLLSDDPTAQLWALVDQSTSLIDSLLTNNHGVKEEQKLLNRYQGLLIWENSERFSDDLWRYKKVYNQLLNDFEESDVLIHRIDNAIKTKNTTPFTQRIDTLQETISVQEKLANELHASLDLKIRQLAVEELHQQQLQLQQYLSQARLSIARLYDQSSMDTSQ